MRKGKLEMFEAWYGLDAPQGINHDDVKTAFFAGWNANNNTRMNDIIECEHQWTGGNDYMLCEKCNFEFNYAQGWKGLMTALKKEL